MSRCDEVVRSQLAYTSALLEAQGTLLIEDQRVYDATWEPYAEIIGEQEILCLASAVGATPGELAFNSFAACLIEDEVIFWCEQWANGTRPSLEATDVIRAFYDIPAHIIMTPKVIAAYYERRETRLVPARKTIRNVDHVVQFILSKDVPNLEVHTPHIDDSRHETPVTKHWKIFW